MSLANYLRNTNGGHKQLDFEGVERVDCKILECDKLVLNGNIYTNENLDSIANLDGILSNENEIIVSKDINATNVKVISNNIVGHIITGNQPEIHTLPNIDSIGNTNNTINVNGNLTINKNLNTPSFSHDGLTGYTTISGNLNCGTITSTTITHLQSQINYLTTKINKIMQYIIIDETDQNNIKIRLKDDVPLIVNASLNVMGEFSQGV